MNISPNLRGIGAVVFATGAFVANDSCMKLALVDSPPLQVLMMRGIAACLWCLPVLFVMGLGRELSKMFNPWVVLRAFCEVFAIFSFITALGMMPLADLTAITQLTPFFVLLGTWMIWGEKIGGIRFLLIVIGIVGAMLVAQPGSAAASPLAIFGFLTAVGAAGRDIATRKVPQGLPALVVTFSTLLIVMLSGAAGSFLFEEQVRVTPRHVWLMTLAGLFQLLGHAFIFLAYRLAPARVVAPFSYSFLLWAGIAGLVLFGNWPNALALWGMSLILLAGLAVILLDGRTRQGDPKLGKA